MKELDRFLQHAAWETTDRYRATVWKGRRLMRQVSFYPDSGRLYDTMPGRYADKEDSNRGDFAAILRQYEGRDGWFVLDESQHITDFVD